MLGQFLQAKILGAIESAKASTDSHIAATTSIHGAVSTATANKLVIRDASGRFQAASPSAAADVATKGWVEGLSYGTGTVTQITAGTGLSGGVITGVGTIALSTTGVGAGSYTNTSVTVDAYGRITAISDGSTGSNVNLSFVQDNISTLQINSSTENNGGAALPAATTSFAGVMAAADKIKLNGIATEANKYSHPSYSAENEVCTGAEVIGTVVSDASGHITSVVKRTLTAGDLGAGTVTSVSGGTGLSSTGGNTPSISHDAHTGDVTGSTSLSIASNVITSGHLASTFITGLAASNALNGADSVMIHESGLGLRETTFSQMVTYFNSNLSFAATSHSHGSYDWSTTLSGATVFDEIDVTNGIVTNISTRTLTAANIGAATSSHSHSTWDRASSILSGATVFSNIVVTNGITTGISTRDLTASDVGAAASSHTHAASSITSGVLGIDRIPTISGSNKVDGSAINIAGTTATTTSDGGDEVLIYNSGSGTVNAIRFDDIDSVRGVDDQHVFIQSTTPTAVNTNDIWIDVS